MTMFELSPSVVTTTASASSMPARCRSVDVHAVPDVELARPVVAEPTERLLALVDDADLPAGAAQLERDGAADAAASDHEHFHAGQRSSVGAARIR